MSYTDHSAQQSKSKVPIGMIESKRERSWAEGVAK